MSWQFATASRLVFGRGTLNEIGALCGRLGITRALIVTDKNLRPLPAFSRLSASLEAAGIKTTVYDDCQPEPPVECAVAAADLASRSGANGIVALGGGSNIDIAKMSSILARHGGLPQDYFGFDRVPGPVVPLVACPTTAGTGSEVSNSSVLTDHAAATKVSSLSHYLRPSLAVVDPDLTDSCPAKVSAHGGIDALVHAIEGITARRCDQMPAPTQLERAYAGSYNLTQVLGLEAVRLIGKSLRQAVLHGDDRSARDDMAQAATLAGMTFSNSGVALVHALEYPIGALTHCSHGEGNGLLLPHVMRYNLPDRVTDFARIGAALEQRPYLEGCSDSEQQSLANRAIAIVEQLQSELGIRTQLRQLGLAEDKLPGIATKAFSIKRLMDTNPRVPTEDELLGILRAAY